MQRAQLKLNLARGTPVASRVSPELKADSVSSRREPTVRLGQLERLVLSYARARDLLSPSDVAWAFGVDRRRAHDALRRLEARGLVRRVARGLYEPAVEDKPRTAANKTTSPPRRPAQDPWVGPLERLILSYIYDRGLTERKAVSLGELANALGARPWSVRHALRRLEARGYVRRVAWGLYAPAADPDWLAKLPVRHVVGRQGQDVVRAANKSPKALGGPRARARHTVWPAQPPTVLPPGPLNLTFSETVFHNVRGYTYSGRYVEGSRGRLLRQGDLVFLDRTSYLEPGELAEGLRLPDHTNLVVYANYSKYGPGRVKVELRPPRGFVARYGAAATVRLFQEVKAVAAYALVQDTLDNGPPDLARWLRRQLLAALGCYELCLEACQATSAGCAAWAPNGTADAPLPAAPYALAAGSPWAASPLPAAPYGALGPGAP